MKRKYHFKWEYCECGCHGSDLEIAGMQFSHIMQDPMNAADCKLRLHEGSHRMGALIGVYKSWEDMDRALATIIRARIKGLTAAIAHLSKPKRKKASDDK